MMTDCSMSLSCASNEDDTSSTASLTSTGSDLSFIEDLSLASVMLSVHAYRLIVVRMNWLRHCCMRTCFMSST
jgi:hypothetical protein